MNAEHTQLQERWEQVISILQANPEVSQRLRGFVSLAQPQAFVGTVLLIAVPSELTRNIFQSQLKAPFQQALTTVFGSGVSEAFTIDESLAQTSQTVSPSIPQIEDDSPMPPLHEVEAELHTPVPPHQSQIADVPVTDVPAASPVDPAIFAERPQSSSPSPPNFPKYTRRSMWTLPFPLSRFLLLQRLRIFLPKPQILIPLFLRIPVGILRHV